MSWEFGSPSLDGINLSDLNVDQAFLNITSYLPIATWMYTLSEDCVRCPFTRTRKVEPSSNSLLKIDASRQLTWKFFEEDHGQYVSENVASGCTVIPNDLGMFGVYGINLRENECSFEVKLQPVNIYLSLLYALLILFGAIVLIYTSNYFYKKWLKTRNLSLDTEQENQQSVKPRLRSLDTFRGTAIVLMIFVNSGGGAYWWIEHATWNGLHVADLVFPWFLWIMGVCIPISIKSAFSRNDSKRTVIWTILKRSIKLFLIGLFLNTRGSVQLENIRIMGVLQRFGIGYFVVATIYVIYYKPIKLLPKGTIRHNIYDISILAYQWVAILCLTTVHLILTFGLRVPGCPRGYLGPGGKQDSAQYMNCIGGATGYIDNLILGENNIYKWLGTRYVYDSTLFEPEGILGCLTTFLQVFIGLQCGITLMVYTEWKPRTLRLLIWSVTLGLLSGILCFFSQDDGPIPINKNLWSLSFVFATCALAYFLLTFFYVIIDVRKWWSGTPLVYAGMNAIVLYVGHSIFSNMFPWHWSIGLMNTHFVLLLENMWNASLWVVIAYYLYSKRIFVSI